MLEKDIESWAINTAKAKGWWTRKFKTPAHRSSPDRIFAKNGSVFFVEFKRTGNSPTELQLEEHVKMHNAGLQVYVCDSRKGDERHYKHMPFAEILLFEDLAC